MSKNDLRIIIFKRRTNTWRTISPIVLALLVSLFIGFTKYYTKEGKIPDLSQSCIIVAIFGFFVFFLLKEYKWVAIQNEELVVIYQYLGFIIRPKRFTLADISMIKMGKYSHATKSPPVLKIYRKKGIVKKIVVKDLFDDARDLHEFVNVFKKRNIEVEFIGDYYYDKIIQCYPDEENTK